MKNNVSCLTLSFIGRHPGYPMERSQWSQYERANEAFFSPQDTFAERFESLVADIQTIGFPAVDVWMSHLNPQWATPAMVATARAILARREIAPQSLYGNIGDDLAQVEASCRTAKALGCTLLAGDCPALEKQFSQVVELLQQNGLRLAIVNRMEKTAFAMHARVGGGVPGVVGITLDTGALAACGYAPEKAIEELADIVLYVCLRDVRSHGLLQQPCRFGQGMVNLPQCIAALHRVQYFGGIAVSEPSLLTGPGADLKASLDMLKAWLKDSPASGSQKNPA